MPIDLALTDYQRAVADMLLTLGPTRNLDALAAHAIQHDRERPAEPRWTATRPAASVAPPALEESLVLDLTLPAASAGALKLRRGDHLRIEQLHDGQGVDVRAWASDGSGISAARTRAAHGVNPTAGAEILTATSRPLLTIVQDSAPGHDLLFPACNEVEYTEHGGLPGHLGCDELHRAALAAAGHDGALSEGVLNLWLPSAVARDGRLRSWPATCRAGDSVTLRADAEVLVTLSCCPDDLFGTSQYEPKPVRVTVGGPAGERPVFGWPSAPPLSAIARHELRLQLAPGDLDHVDRWAERGWLGYDRSTVTRALIFRFHESLRARPPAESAI